MLIEDYVVRVSWRENCCTSVDIGWKAYVSSLRLWRSDRDVNVLQSDNLTLDSIVPISAVAWHRADKEDETKLAEPGFRCTTMPAL